MQTASAFHLVGAFISEEHFEKGVKKACRTLYHDGTLLQLFYSKALLAPEMLKFLPDVDWQSVEKRTKSSETFGSEEERGLEIGLVSFPFEKELISILGIFKGNEKFFSLKGNVLFNNSLYICPVKMILKISKNSVHFEIPSFSKVIKSISSFFMQVQLSQMNLFLQKPDPTKINGYHIYNVPGSGNFQGLFLNDHLVIHKDHIEDCGGFGRNPVEKVKPPTIVPFDCHNCLGKPVEGLLGGSTSIKNAIALIKSKLCKVCKAELFKEKDFSQKFNSMENQKEFRKKLIVFLSNLKDYDMTANPAKMENLDQMEKVEFPYEKAFEIQTAAYGKVDYQKENHKSGPTTSPNFFKGEIKNGKKQGFVYENFEGDECFAGFYKDGFRIGFGQLYKYGKYYYEGQFRKGRKHGKGAIWFANGEHQVSQFNNNLMTEESPKVQSKSQEPQAKMTPSISPSRSNVTDKSPRRRRVSRNQKAIELSKPSPKFKVEFSRLQANSRAMRQKRKRVPKPLNLFKEELEQQKKSETLKGWINDAQERIHRPKKKSRPKWTKEQQELFDDKSDLEVSDIDRSQLSKLKNSQVKSVTLKSPMDMKKTIFLFENKRMLNFQIQNDKTSIFS